MRRWERLPCGNFSNFFDTSVILLPWIFLSAGFPAASPICPALWLENYLSDGRAGTEGGRAKICEGRRSWNFVALFQDNNSAGRHCRAVQTKNPRKRPLICRFEWEVLFYSPPSFPINRFATAEFAQSSPSRSLVTTIALSRRYFLRIGREKKKILSWRQSVGRSVGRLVGRPVIRARKVKANLEISPRK